MALQTENLISIKKCDSKTIEEIRLVQNTIIEIIKIIKSQKDLRFNNFKSMLKLNPNIRDLLHIEVDVDPDKPFPSLNKWILSISKGSERNKNVFMQRMGMNGKRPQTYQQIAIEHNISRERVRGITEKIKRIGQTSIYRLGLNPLIERAEKIVRSAGWKMTFSDLNTHLLCNGPQGELLKYAEYLICFPSWQKAGLNKKESIVYLETDLNE